MRDAERLANRSVAVDDADRVAFGRPVQSRSAVVHAHPSCPTLSLRPFPGKGDAGSGVPNERLVVTEAVLARMGAKVTRRFYPGLGHEVAVDELEDVRRLVEEVAR